ncbi:13986_t:CDS:2, partial [Racocetra persica]
MSSDIDETSESVNHVNRYLRPSWKDEYPWLEFDMQNKRMFCTLCRACNKKNAFAKNGSTNIKLYAVKEHTKTKDHISSEAKKEIINAPPGHVISLMKIVYSMARNDFPLSKFNQLTLMGRAIESPHLISKDCSITYENNIYGRELLSSIALSIENKLWNELCLATAI